MPVGIPSSAASHPAPALTRDVAPAAATGGPGGGRPRPRMLVVGPLPPPLGGVQLMNEMLIRSSLSRDFEIHAVDTSKGVLRWAVETQSWRSPLYFLRDLARLIAALIRLRPDIVYVHAASGFSFMRDWALMLIARLAGAPVVCHYHGTLHTVFPSALTATGRLAGHLMMRAAHRVIVLGPGYRASFAAAWRRDDLAWVPNFTDVALQRSVSGEEGAPWLEPGERAVLFMGRLSAPKGIWELLEAAPRVLARHPEARFVLCGVAETQAQEPVLRAAVEARGLAPRVRFLGSLEGRDKLLAYATSSLLVVPSRTEAFPLVIPEGMAAGLPIVASSVGAIPDYVVDGEDGFLVPPRDAAALAAGINRLLDDEPLRRRIAARVRERAGREFDIEIGAARVRAVLVQLLDATGARRPDR